jgi:O-antigen ligase
MPYQPIQGSDVTRVISTLGGPNQLGAFLILPLVLSLYLGIRKRNWLYAPIIVLFLAAMFFSHSRSAWIGAIIATGLVLILTLKKRTLWRLGWAGGIAVLLMGIAITTYIQDSPFLQATILHSDYDRAFRASSNTDCSAASTKLCTSPQSP